MTFDEIKKMVNESIDNGFMFEQDHVMLNTDKGANYSTLAVLGTLLINAGQPEFINYLDVQVKGTSWLIAKANPITQSARGNMKLLKLKQGYALNLYNGLYDTFIKGLIEEHVKMGGKNMSSKHELAILAMILAKINWDHYLGNKEFSNEIKNFWPEYFNNMEKNL